MLRVAMTGESILVVEDEDRQRERLAHYLERQGYEVEAAGCAEDGLSLLEKRGFAALISDLRLPGMDGLELIRRARQLDEEIVSLLITAYASVETAVEALRVGAHDYILKPVLFEELERKLRHLVGHRELLRENRRLRAVLQENQESEIVGESAAMAEVRRWVERAAGTRATVLITGATGTGKEVVARAIHRLGPHRDDRMLSINVAALPATMVESELFGHERGAFTGADRRREGILRAAGEGTVFLDEIGDLDPDAQAKLLRALEAREVLPLGSDRAVPFRARIVAATHRDLGQAVREGRFREDLYYRLNVLHIHIPPLRERPEDVPPLVHHLLAKLASRNGLAPPVVSAEAMRALRRYAWPGNVRELANVLERALILADEGRITPEHLPDDVTEETEAGGLALQDAVAAFERSHIRKVLRLCGGNRERAAKELGLSPATLYRRIEKLGLKGYLAGGSAGHDKVS